MATYVPSVSNSAMSYLPPAQIHSLFVTPTTRAEIEHEIRNLKPSKTTGPYSIPIKILKILGCLVSKPLEIIYNSSLSLGIVPHQFKIANVIPVFKNGSQISLTNYRPISLLLIFNKILEKMFTRLSNFINKHDLLYNKQFGFIHLHSTLHATLSIIDNIQKAFEERLLAQ